jgi:phosphate starvation-inducible protein PhoH and related proteins
LSQKRLTKKQQRALRHQGVLDENNEINVGKFEMMNVDPMTETQARAYMAWEEGKNLLLHGCAGTGKTFIGLHMAIQSVLAGEFKKVVIVRSAVPTRDIGFLPGSVEEKLKVYEQPYSSITKSLFGRGDAYDILKNKFMVDFVPTSFIRGTTIDNAVVLVDEINNLTFHELDSVITRLGSKTRMILCGDMYQSDLKFRDEQDGLVRFMNIINKMDMFESLEFDMIDIVRSGMVKQYLIAKDRTYV